MLSTLCLGGGAAGQLGTSPSRMSVIFARTGMGEPFAAKSQRRLSAQPLAFSVSVREPSCLHPSTRMAPHLSPSELDFIHLKSQAGLTPIEIHARLSSQRAKRRVEAPHLTNVRKAIKGLSYKRGRVETRGRPLLYTRKMVERMDAARKALVKKADNQREVRWADVRRAARVPDGHRSSLKRAFAREGIPVAARRPREKPQRTQEHEAERLAFAKAFASKSPSYFTDRIDMIIDNKTFDVPTTERARRHLKSQQVRFHLRTPSEGTAAEFTKPGRKKNRMNTGAKAGVCAGVSNGKIVLWHYLPKAWNGQVAADLYTDVIYPLLKRVRGQKRSYLLLEDNDPTGYKSGKAKAAKAEKGIKAHPFPRYSPEINPLDFSLWKQVEAKVLATAPTKLETVAQYKARLRKTALGMPRSAVEKAVAKMAEKIRELKDAKGGNIRSD